MSARAAGFAPLPDGGHLAYELAGPPRMARPLLLLRPLAGPMALWGPFRDALAARTSLIAFDPRGIGASSALAPRTSTRSMARDALALLEHLGVARANVFGLSLGGMVATWLAIDASSRVARLVLASTLPRGAAVSPAAARPALPLAACLAGPRRELGACLARKVLSAEFRSAHPERVRAIEAVLRAAPPPRATVVAHLAAAARHDARAQLRTITAPTLVLTGALDPLVGATARRTFQQRVPDVTVGELLGCGHDLSLEAPQEAAARVLAFLEGAPSG